MALMLTLQITSTSNVLAQEPSSEPLRVVSSVDLARYCGTWYEIARLPNRFQSDCVCDVSASYTLLPDGEINVINRCTKSDGTITEAEGRAKRAGEGEPNSKLKVRFAPAFLSFLPFVWGDYWIIDLASDYSYAVVGEPARKYLWILARSKQIDDGLFAEIVERVRRQGYDVSTLIKTIHTK